MTETSLTEASRPLPIRWTIPVTAQIAMAIIALVFGGILLSGFLNFVKFEKTLSTLADSHYAFLLGDIEGAIEDEAAIGVPLSAAHNIQELLGREIRMEPAITRVEVSDISGHVLYAWPPDRIGQAVPAAWPAQAKPHALWRVERADTVTLGQPILNAFDEGVGTLALTYSEAYYQRKSDQVLQTLLHKAVPLTVASCIIALLGCLLVLRRLRRSVGGMAHDLEDLLADRPVDLQGRRPGSALERQFALFLSRIARAKSGDPAPAAEAQDGEEDQQRGLLYPTFILTAVVLLVPLCLISWTAVGAFEKALVPEMHAEGAALARAVSKDLTRALDLKIPIEQLIGTEAYLDSMLALVPGAKYIAITDESGTLLYSGGLTTTQVSRALHHGHPLPTGPDVDYGLIETQDYVDITTVVPSPDPNSFGRGFIHVGISRDVLTEQTRDIFFNVCVMSLSGLLITFELLMLVMVLVILHPLSLLRGLLAAINRGNLGTHVRTVGRSELGRLILLMEAGVEKLRSVVSFDRKSVKELHAPNLVFMRTPLFLFCFAEEFARSFFPLYTNQLAETIHGVSSAMLASLPITIFMLLVAGLTPISAIWSDRRGRRPIFLIGAALSTLGLVLTAIAGDYWQLLLYRALSGAGYAMVFIASQGYVLDNTSEKDRTRGMAVYVAAITAADVAGPPIGGIIVDQLGFRGSFAVAACFVALAAILAGFFMRDEKQDRVERRPLRRSDVLLLLQNTRFLSLIVGVSMPAKLLLAGFLFYLVPLHLSMIGQSESAIGRVIMIYAVSCIAFTPVAARIADKWKLQQTVVIGGALIAGLSLIASLLADGMAGMLIAVAGLGVGQAFSLAAQSTLVTEYAAEETEWLGRTTVLSIFRLVERLGAVIGPLIAGVLLVAFGARDAIAILGAIAVAGALLLLVALRFTSSEGASS
jgi:predicted MFS family arabinose efflux permease